MDTLLLPRSCWSIFRFSIAKERIAASRRGSLHRNWMHFVQQQRQRARLCVCTMLFITWLVISGTQRSSSHQFPESGSSGGERRHCVYRCFAWWWSSIPSLIRILSTYLGNIMFWRRYGGHCCVAFRWKVCVKVDMHEGDDNSVMQLGGSLLNPQHTVFYTFRIYVSIHRNIHVKNFLLK